MHGAGERAAAAHRVGGKADEKAVASGARAAGAGGLSNRATHFPGGAVRGERQRVAIARAMMNEAGVVVV